MAASVAFLAPRHWLGLPFRPASWSASARGHRTLGWGRRRPFRLDARHLLLAIAVGSVAVLWSRARRRRGAAPRQSPPPERRSTLRPPPQPVDTFRWQPVAGVIPDAALGVRPPGAEMLPVWTVPEYAANVGLPWVQQAALAVHRGRADELRRIAVEMDRAGLDAEAGLLNNYALLLERSRASRPRVLTEVTRMLQAATAHRRTIPAAALDEPIGAPTMAATPAPPPATINRASQDASTRPLIPMPTLPIEARRRAAR
jgi:hypothetical protein